MTSCKLPKLVSVGQERDVDEPLPGVSSPEGSQKTLSIPIVPASKPTKPTPFLRVRPKPADSSLQVSLNVPESSSNPGSLQVSSSLTRSAVKRIASRERLQMRSMPVKPEGHSRNAGHDRSTHSDPIKSHVRLNSPHERPLSSRSMASNRSGRSAAPSRQAGIDSRPVKITTPSDQSDQSESRPSTGTFNPAVQRIQDHKRLKIELKNRLLTRREKQALRKVLKNCRFIHEMLEKTRDEGVEVMCFHHQLDHKAAKTRRNSQVVNLKKQLSDIKQIHKQRKILRKERTNEMLAADNSALSPSDSPESDHLILPLIGKGQNAGTSTLSMLHDDHPQSSSRLQPPSLSTHSKHAHTSESAGIHSTRECLSSPFGGRSEVQSPQSPWSPQSPHSGSPFSGGGNTPDINVACSNILPDILQDTIMAGCKAKLGKLLGMNSLGLVGNARSRRNKKALVLPEIPRLRSKYRGQRQLGCVGCTRPKTTEKKRRERMVEQLEEEIGLEVQSPSDESHSPVSSLRPNTGIYSSNFERKLNQLAELRRRQNEEKAATTIQLVWRARALLRYLGKINRIMRHAVVTLQRWWRFQLNFILPLYRRLAFRPERIRAVEYIQARVKGWSDRRWFATAKSALEVEKQASSSQRSFEESAKKIECILRIQRSWRSHKNRVARAAHEARLKQARSSPQPQSRLTTVVSPEPLSPASPSADPAARHRRRHSEFTTAARRYSSFNVVKSVNALNASARHQPAKDQRLDNKKFGSNHPKKSEGSRFPSNHSSKSGGSNEDDTKGVDELNGFSENQTLPLCTRVQEDSNELDSNDVPIASILPRLHPPLSSPGPRPARPRARPGMIGRLEKSSGVLTDQPPKGKSRQNYKSN